MSKYDLLWKYISQNKNKNLTFEKIEEICNTRLDHSFLQYKVDLEEYGWKVKRISMKEQVVVFEKIK